MKKYEKSHKRAHKHSRRRRRKEKGELAAPGCAIRMFVVLSEEEEEGLNNRDEGVGCCGVHMEF